MDSFNRVAFFLFGFPIYWYGLCVAAAFIVGSVLALMRQTKSGLPENTVIDFLIVVIPSALVCARIYYVIFNWSLYSGNWVEIFNFRHGGLAVYGGIAGGVIAGVLYARHKKISFGQLADVLAPSVVLGQAIGRWGNFFNQEAYGGIVTNEALHFFPVAVFIQAEAQWHYAAFFYESLWCVFIFVLLLVAEKKKMFIKRGDAFIWYIVLYAVEPAVVEQIRMDSLYFSTIRISQWVSMAALLCAASLFFYRSFRSSLSRSVTCGAVCVLCAAFTSFFAHQINPLYSFGFNLLFLLSLFFLYSAQGPKESVLE